MKKFWARISFEAPYNADSEEQVKEMISEEYGLGDVANLEIDIDEVKDGK